MPPEQVPFSRRFAEQMVLVVMASPCRCARSGFPAPRCTRAMGWWCLLSAVPTGSGEPTLPKRNDWREGRTKRRKDEWREREALWAVKSLGVRSLLSPWKEKKSREVFFRSFPTLFQNRRIKDYCFKAPDLRSGSVSSLNSRSCILPHSNRHRFQSTLKHHSVPSAISLIFVVYRGGSCRGERWLEEEATTGCKQWLLLQRQLYQDLAAFSLQKNNKKKKWHWSLLLVENMFWLCFQMALARVCGKLRLATER